MIGFIGQWAIYPWAPTTFFPISELLAQPLLGLDGPQIIDGLTDDVDDAA